MALCAISAKDRGQIMERSKLEKILADLRQWHELNARELEGEEGEGDNLRFHLESAEAIKEAINKLL